MTYQQERTQALRESLDERLREIDAMPREVTDRDELRRPPDITIHAASQLGHVLISGECPFKELNLSVAGDGTVLFTLFGVAGRELELWVDQTYSAMYVASAHSTIHEGQLPISRCGELMPWLFHGCQLPG